MAHWCKCSVCGEKFDRDKEQAVRSGARRYAHLKCDPDNPNLVEAEAPKPKTKEKIDDGRRLFTDTLQMIFGDDANYSSATKLAKQYMEEYNFTYIGMAKTLEWYYVICKHNKKKANGSIGIVPYVYKQAKDYYAKIEKINQVNANKEKIQDTVIEIKIQEPKRTERKIKSFWEDDEE